MVGWMNRWLDGWMDGWMVGRMGGWVDGWMGGWLGGCILSVDKYIKYRQARSHSPHQTKQILTCRMANQKMVSLSDAHKYLLAIHYVPHPVQRQCSVQG